MVDRQSRFRSLDSLRGLAALTVVVQHSLDQFPLPFHSWLLDVPPLGLLWAALPAVVFFFVLSGFVLSLPWHAGRAPAYQAFALRRAARLWPTYALAVAVSAAWAAVLLPRFPASGLFPPGRTLLQYLPMVGPYQNGILDIPIWTLIHEMRISLLFPLLLFALAGRWGHLPALLLLSVGAGIAYTATGNDLWQTLQYLPMFAVGAWLAYRRDRLTAWYAARRARTRWAIAIGSLALYGTWLPGLLPLVRDGLWQLPVVLGSCGLIVVALGEPAVRARLQWRPLALLGSASYSLYLVHGLVIYPVAPLLAPHLPGLAAIAICWAILLPLTYLVYRFVELPSIALSHRIGRPRLRPVEELEPAPAA